MNRTGSQIVFVDTPGIHRSGTLLNQRIVDQALQAVEDVDLVLFMVDAVSMNHAAENMILSRLKLAGKPVLLVLNKIDLAEKQAVFERTKALTPMFEFTAVVPISARQNIQVDRLMDEVETHLPRGPRLYPEDTFTDVTEKFLVKEIIREKVFRLTGMEIPYSSAVTVDAFEVEKRCIVIHASIHVVRNSQKGIIIGKKDPCCLPSEPGPGRTWKKCWGKKYFSSYL